MKEKDKIKAGFWQKLKKPILVLAPMADVTDAAFRQIIAKYGKPDVMFTEFVSADGLYYTRELKNIKDGDNPLFKDLEYSESERPIVAQLFTSKPEIMEYASKIIYKLGFDGIDINMGCPAKPVVKQGAGAALIGNKDLAIKLVEAAIKGGQGLPVSVKTRVGLSQVDLEAWLPALLSTKVAAITIHARTRKQMSKVPANWEYIKRAVEIRNELGSTALIIGNGDVLTPAMAKIKVKETGCDGVMIGRGIFGNPYLFNKKKKIEKLTISEKLDLVREHSELFNQLLPNKNFAIMKKHFKAYINGWDGAKELRMQLMLAETAVEVGATVEEYKQKNGGRGKNKK